MNQSIEENVLFIGIDCRNPKGGVASVEYEYSRQFKPFKFVATCVSGGKVAKAAAAAKGVVKFVLKLLTDKKIQLIHVNAASDASFWRKRIFINIAKLFGKKIIYHNHGGGFKRFYGEHPRAVMKTLHKADCVIALSESWRDFFANELKCKRVEVINNPVTPPEQLPPTDSYALSGKLRMLFLGAIMPAKGIFDLIDILDENREVYAGKIELLIGGNGEVDKLLKLIEQRQLGELVKFQGWVNGEKKDLLLRQTDVYVLPSYFEGLPISILEAMTYGKPVIASNVGGIPEIVKDGMNGYLVEPGDKEAIKRSIDMLLVDSEKRGSMGVKGQQMAVPYHSATVADSLRQLYTSLI